MVQIAPYMRALGAAKHEYLKGLIDAPEDREAAVRKVIEAAGGKVISFYVTTGETTFSSVRKLTRLKASSPR